MPKRLANPADLHDDRTRQGLHINVCGPAAEGWREFCEREGVSLTALIDAMGHQLQVLLPLSHDEQVAAAPAFMQAIAHGRRIDVARRSRDARRTPRR